MSWLRRAAALLVALVATAASAAPAAHRVGVVQVGADEDVRAACLAYFGARRDAQVDPFSDLFRESEDASQVGEKLEEMRIEGVDLVVVFGDAASLTSRALRDRPAVFATSDPEFAEELRRAGNACVVAAVPPRAVGGYLRRACPDLRCVGVVVPSSDTATEKDIVRGGFPFFVARTDASTPRERAAQALAKLVPATDVVWLPPSVPAEDAAALAVALEGRGIPLVGSRTAHFRAGCALALRSDPQSTGGLVAALAHEMLSRDEPPESPVRTPRRYLLDVNLPAAERLGYRPPLALLAWADTIVRPRPVTR